MQKKWLLLIILGIMIGIPSQGFSAPATSDFSSSIDKIYQVGEFDEKFEAIIPENTFNSDLDIEWDAELEAKSSKGKTDAYIRFSFLLPNGERRTILQLAQGQHDQGTIRLPKGHRLVVELYAGQYQFLLNKSGVKSICRLKIPTLIIRSAETSSLYGFRFEAAGPGSIDRWVWSFGDGTEATGSSVEHVFPTPGRYKILLQGYRDSQLVRKSKIDFVVPDFAEFQPSLSPLEGAVEFKVTGETKLKSHYGQEAVCIWNFGNGTDPVSADTASHVYQTVGRYTVTLTVQSAEFNRTISRSWEINARPLYIINQTEVGPLTGIIPLTINVKSDPIYEGSPIKIKYAWDFGDGTTSDQAQADHAYTKPGNYIVTLKIWDENHPSILLPAREFMVQALPPVIRINPQANPGQGPIPMKVSFHPFLWSQGSPTQISFRWDFGDGTGSDQAEPEHVYTKPGNYNVSLVVKENIHSIIVSGFLRIAATAPLITAAGKVTPTNGTAPLTINCTAEPKVEGIPTELVYEWDFGDGEKARGKETSHTYSVAGTYIVKLKVSDQSPEYQGASSETTFAVSVKAKK